MAEHGIIFAALRLPDLEKSPLTRWTGSRPDGQFLSVEGGSNALSKPIQGAKLTVASESREGANQESRFPNCSEREEEDRHEKVGIF